MILKCTGIKGIPHAINKYWIRLSRNFSTENLGYAGKHGGWTLWDRTEWCSEIKKLGLVRG